MHFGKRKRSIMLLVGVSFILQLFLKRNCPNQDEGAELAVFSKLFWETRPLRFAIVPDPLSSLLHHFVFSFRASLLWLAHTKGIMLSLPISNCPVCLSTMPSVLISELQHGAEFDAFWKLNVAHHLCVSPLHVFITTCQGISGRL